MNWVLSKTEELCFTLLNVKRYCGYVRKRPYFIFLELHTEVFRSVMTWYLGFALKCFGKKIELERERDEINRTKSRCLVKMEMAFLVLFSLRLFGSFPNT